MSHDHALSCREMAEHLSAYLDGELAASITALIDAHRGECPPCEAFIRTLAKSVEVVRAQPREPLSPALRKKLVEALRGARPRPSGL
jgi:predicted anti-sigma-YlaC factor YlaD